MVADKQRKTFLSYSRVNKDFAIKLAKELKAEGFDIWLDQLDIEPGRRWDDEVERALEECEIFMVMITPASSASDNVKDEIGYAIDSRKRILPILLENATLPLRLRRLQYVDFTSKGFNEGVESAKELLKKLIAQPTVQRTEMSDEQRQQVSQAQAIHAAKVGIVEESKELEDREAKAEADRLAKQKAEEERIAKDKVEIDRRIKEEAERLYVQRTEEDRLAKVKAEEERAAKAKAKEETDRLAAQKAETDRVAKQKAEDERLAKAKAEIERKAKAEAERKAKQDREVKAEADRLAAQKAEADRVAKQKAEDERLAKAKAETERKAKQEADRLAVQKAEEERIAKEKMTPVAMMPIQTKAGRALPVTIAPSNKSPIGALLLSFILFGGVGQIYLGQWKKGIVLIVTTILTSFIVVGVLFYLYGVIDAYAIAKKMRDGHSVREWEFGFSWKGALITVALFSLFLLISYFLLSLSYY